MDSDLAESINALKASLESARVAYSLGAGEPEHLRQLQERFGLPRRYLEFLAECDPLELNVATPAEHVQLIGSEAFEQEQAGYCLSEDGKRISAPTKSAWRPNWIVIGHNGLGDPYFLDVTSIDAEGDCPVYTAMSGTDVWQQTLCASSFAMFVRILAITLEVAEDFDLDDYDPDNERVFREAVGPRIREVDPAAVKGGHWT